MILYHSNKWNIKGRNPFFLFNHIMSFIIDIAKDTDRVLLNKIDKLAITLKLIWQHGTEYCFDTQTYEDYKLVKQLQIRLDQEGYTNVPVV